MSGDRWLIRKFLEDQGRIDVRVTNPGNESAHHAYNYRRTSGPEGWAVFDLMGA